MLAQCVPSESGRRTSALPGKNSTMWPTSTLVGRASQSRYKEVTGPRNGPRVRSLHRHNVDSTGARDERLLDGAEELALEENLLGHLRTEIRVRRLLLDEDAAELAKLTVHRGHLHLNGARTNVELLVVLLEKRLIATSLERRKSDSLIIAGRGAAALGVKEEASTVGGDDE
mmetsp:Transcript_6142/g.9254  ORF Transcript_6142/g.9254 Transcript_6142/m.9254 type:complete len:172 (+) Transcript_6142:158-673(+)